MASLHFEKAKSVIPGGVNSPVRSFKGVGGEPIFIETADGALLFDINGKSYIDYVCSWGAIILGHAHPLVVSEVQRAATRGMSFGAPTLMETQIAEKICDIASIDKVRLVNSGTEACMSAIRLARGYTGREIIVKFEGCYHGHVDSLLVKAGSGSLTCGTPDSAGIPAEVASKTIVLPYNDKNALLALFEDRGFEIAAVIIEPIAGNMNCVPSHPEFLQLLRRLCTECDAVLIMDEVMSGFRVAIGGAQEVYGVKGDLVCFGKVIGGGLPIGAFGGRSEIMQHLAPEGEVYQAGTLSGNPIAISAGLATLNAISSQGFYQKLDKQVDKLIQGLLERAQESGIAMLTNQVGGMWGVFFTEQADVLSLQDVMKCNSQRFRIFFHEMLKEGIYLAPSAFEASFISASHNDAIIEATLSAAEKVLSRIKLIEQS